MKTLFIIISVIFILFCKSSIAQNVGIGTATPLTKLHVYNGASGATPFAFSPLAVESNNHTYINILSPAANEGGILFGQPGSAANGSVMYNNVSTPNGFQFRTNGNLTRMVIDNGGYMGIGTIMPTSKLEITHNGASAYGTALLINQNAIGNSDGPKMQFLKMMTIPKSWTAGILNGVNIGTFAISEDGGTGGFGTPRFTIAPGGNVGINTNNPGATLDVNGNLNFTSVACINGFCPPAGAIRLTPNLHLNTTPGNAVIINWDNGFTADPSTRNFRIGNGLAGDMFYTTTGGNAWLQGILTFPPSLGKKITLYPGATGDVGFAVAGNRLQIYSDNPNADVAIGYDAAGTFNERFAFKPNGALAINGNAGTAGQILQSNGSGAAPTWITGTVHSIGESYGGGIVFYVYDNGQHGLIAATTDYSPDIQWNNGSYNYTNAIRDGIGAGKFNTERITYNYGAGTYAAQVSANFQAGNYGDWYLPSKYELNLLYQQRSAVGGFSNVNYWSSSEVNGIYAWIQSFATGVQSSFGDKATFRYMREIRAF